MSWLRIESNFVHHFKVKRLADHLKISNAEAGWSIMHALSWFSQLRPTGQVAGQHRSSDELALEEFCGWEGSPGRLVAGLIAVGLMDEVADDGGFAYHDWPEYQGKVTENAEKARVRKAKWRAKQAADKAAEKAGLSHGTDDGTNAGRPALRDGTGRDGTERSSSYEDDGAPPPSPEVVQFFDWFQARRGAVANGTFVREKPPDDLGEWFGGVCKALDAPPATAIDALKIATNGYMKDKYWLANGGQPWAGFAEQWARHVLAPRRQETFLLGPLNAVGT
jgi:hypothetical protein